MPRLIDREQLEAGLRMRVERSRQYLKDDTPEGVQARMMEASNAMIRAISDERERNLGRDPVPQIQGVALALSQVVSGALLGGLESSECNEREATAYAVNIFLDALARGLAASLFGQGDAVGVTGSEQVTVGTVEGGRA